MKLVVPALLCLAALALTGCSSPATSAPSHSALSNSAHPSSAGAAEASVTPKPSGTPALVDGLPASCDALFAGGLKKFVSPDGSLALDPAWKSGPGTQRTVAGGYGTYDPILAGMLSQNPGLVCDWAPPTGPSDTFLTTQLRHVDAATEQAALARIRELGWVCSSMYGGEWCLTNDAHSGRAIGESQFLGNGDWLASNWNDAGPETYTPRLLGSLFG